MTRYSQTEKMEIVRQVGMSELPLKQTLAHTITENLRTMSIDCAVCRGDIIHGEFCHQAHTNSVKTG